MKEPEVNAIESGRCILFVGAGFSFGASNLEGKPIVSATRLSKLLLEACEIKDDTGYDLDTAAEEYVTRFGDEALVTLLHKNFTSKDSTDDQKTIICQPWHRIYTTNYDDIIEKIAHLQNKALTTKEIADPVEPPLNGVTQLIHIYGNISRVSPAEFKRQFLLTERQRDNSAFINSPWKWRFNDDVLAAQAVVFAGFSLTDIDLSRALLKVSLYGRIFKSSNLEKQLEPFYDGCRPLSIAKRDPLFLVQRSITSMSANRFSSSKKFIDTAYAMAKTKPRFDTYQIDTHFAKVLLTESLHDGLTDRLDRETEAHDLIESVVKRRQNDLYHPLSVLRLDSELVKKWGPEMSPEQRKAMSRLVTRAERLLEAFPDRMRQRHRSVFSVKQGLQQAKKILSN